jgi:hypothetical protein
MRRWIRREGVMPMNSALLVVGDLGLRLLRLAVDVDGGSVRMGWLLVIRVAVRVHPLAEGGKGGRGRTARKWRKNGSKSVRTTSLPIVQLRCDAGASVDPSALVIGRFLEERLRRGRRRKSLIARCRRTAASERSATPPWCPPPVPSAFSCDCVPIATFSDFPWSQLASSP